MLRIACANEGPLDHCCVSWRSRVSQVCVHSVVIDPGRGTSVASSHLSPFFFCFSFCFFFLRKPSFKKKCSVNVFLCPFVLFPIFRTIFWLLCFDFSPKSKFSWQKIHFSSFHFLVLFSFFLSFFLSSWFCQGDLIAEDKTRHQEKWVKPMVRMVNKVWKGGLLLACFSAWPKVWVDGPESTMENALADDFWLGWAAIVCFLWLSDFCVTLTARGTPASECLSSSPFVFSLSTLILLMFTLLPQHVAKSYWKHWATWGGEAEPRGFNGLCRRSKEDRARKTKSWRKTTQHLRTRNKQTGRWSHRGSRHQRRAHERLPYKAHTYFAHGLGEESVQRY